jgi:outer membrane murein-binding lipoprotein Lpp
LPVFTLLPLALAVLGGGCYERQSEAVQDLQRRVIRLETESARTELRLDEVAACVDKLESHVKQLNDETSKLGFGRPGGLKSRVSQLESDVSSLRLKIMLLH